jgi:prepilin-type N-terminal cleavage/methylation domain-containing protein
MIINYRKFSKGFTLIELLVVIAIIGVLSSVVLASLRNSNLKARDAKVKSQLNAIIPIAQIYYDIVNSGSWTGVCTNQTSNANIDAMVVSATNNRTAGNCQGSAQLGWRASGALASQNLHTAGTSGTDYWCVDYTAASRICDTLPNGVYGGVYVCPATAPELCK